MIVDVHVHAPTSHMEIPGDADALKITRIDKPVAAPTVDDMLTALEPVDRAFVFGIWWQPIAVSGRPLVNLNDETAAVLKADPEKLIGFMSVHPDEPDVVEEIDRCVDELGFRGIKLGPNYQNFDPLGENALRVYEVAQRRGLPIVFHQGTSPVRRAPLRYAHPLVMDEIALAFPELRVVMAHLGHPWFADTIAVVRKHPHVYADVSGLFYRPWSAYNGLLLATEWGVLGKLLFASDFPIAAPRETLDRLRGVNAPVDGTPLPRVPAEEIEQIIQRDTLALLGLA